MYLQFQSNFNHVIRLFHSTGILYSVMRSLNQRWPVSRIRSKTATKYVLTGRSNGRDAHLALSQTALQIMLSSHTCTIFRPVQLYLHYSCRPTYTIMRYTKDTQNTWIAYVHSHTYVHVGLYLHLYVLLQC